MTKTAGSVDLVALLQRLARRRPVFHSEADFQHAFAWEAHSIDPELRVRLETHPEPGARLDLMLSRTDLDRHTAVELKYLTAGWVGDVGGEHFELKNQGAQDVRAYDVVKDIGRLERFVDRKRHWTVCSSQSPTSNRSGGRSPMAVRPTRMPFGSTTG